VHTSCLQKCKVRQTQYTKVGYTCT